MSFLGETVRQRKVIFQNPLVKFSAIVVLIFIGFFSVSSTKLPNYPMPCYPFAAIVLGSFLSSLLNKQIGSKKYPYYLLLAFTLIIPVAGYFAIGSEPEAMQVKVVALTLLITPFIFLIYLFTKSPWQKKIAIIFVAYLFFNFIGLNYVYPVLYNQNPVAKTIDMVKRSSNIYCYTSFNPGYRFYLDKNIPVTKSVDTLKNWLQHTKDAIVITQTYYLDSLKNLPLEEIARHHDIFELPTTVIFKKNAKF